MATFKTYDPLSTSGYRNWNFYAYIIVLLIISLPIIYFMPSIKSKIAVFASCLIFIFLLFLIGKFYNLKYNGGAEVNVTKEAVEIKLPNSEMKVFSIESIKKIKSHDNSSAKYSPDMYYDFIILLTFIIWTSSGKVRLRFTEQTGKRFIKEILKYKKPKRKGANIFLRLIHSNLEVYYF